MYIELKLRNDAKEYFTVKVILFLLTQFHKLNAYKRATSFVSIIF